jgi:hypothetical protein
MPVIIHGIKKQAPPRTARGRAFDSAIQKFAPIIAKLQGAGCLGIHQLAEHLNQTGVAAPSGEPFSYTTTRRVLRRLAQLGLAQAPLSSAGSRQHTAKRANEYLCR